MISYIKSGKISLGIEIGSTRIKSVLTTYNNEIIATGEFEWKSKFEYGYWTYDIEDVLEGVQNSYASLKKSVKNRYGESLREISYMGISAMMHGFLILDEKNRLIVPFRTWQNTDTQESSRRLIEIFNFPIPNRWSIAHLYQAILDGEDYVSKISYMTTLAGYIHMILTGEKVIGIGDGSGIFPIKNHQFDSCKIDDFNKLVKTHNIDIDLAKILPKVLSAGREAGRLTDKGAKLLDPSGELKKGTIFCPPEGDAQTGMVATNSVGSGKGNISAGTSIFASIVTKKSLSRVYDQVDLLQTPEGMDMAMVHANNCTGDINAWVDLFEELINTLGLDAGNKSIHTILFEKSLQGNLDGGNILAYNFLSGEHILGINRGRPMLIRNEDSELSLANLMKTHIYTSIALLKMGVDVLKKEGVRIDELVGHGGFFKTPKVGQKAVSAALDRPIKVMKNANSGGAWGVAILANYLNKYSDYRNLDDYLTNEVFKDIEADVVYPNQEEVDGYATFYARYIRGLDLEKKAIKLF